MSDQPFIHPIVRAIEARRRQLGISQRELAERAGTTQSHVSAVMAGKTSVSLDVAERFARALGLTFTLSELGKPVAIVQHVTPPALNLTVRYQNGKYLIQASETT